MTDQTTPCLGKVIDDPETPRDAIHIAVAPVVATQRLSPGEPIELLPGSQSEVRASRVGIGIVDPFLLGPVYHGDRFWAFLYPMTITSLRHDWTHPAFEDVAPRTVTSADRVASKAWLRTFVQDEVGYVEDEAELDQAVAAFIAAAESGADCDGYIHVGGFEASGSVPAEFYDHVEIVTGKKIAQRGSTFSCSC